MQPAGLVPGSGRPTIPPSCHPPPALANSKQPCASEAEWEETARIYADEIKDEKEWFATRRVIFYHIKFRRT